MTNKQNDMSKTYIIIAAILGLAILGYGFMNYNAKMKVLESEKQAQIDKLAAEYIKQGLYDTCLTDAHELYLKNWNGSCKRLGKKDGCTLSTDIGSRWDEAYNQEKKVCLERFGKQ